MRPTTNLEDGERCVIKIGGSVLYSDEAYAYQARRIIDFSQSRDIERVYVILSARKGHTDELANNLCSTPDERESLRRLLKQGDYSNSEDVKRFDCSNVASYLLSGEIASTLRFEKELRKAGIYPERLVQGVNFPITANGRYLHADVDFEACDTSVLDDLSKIVLVPGFGAQNHHKEKVLLGRNASDYVAALIGRLDHRVREVIYLKDVDGVYENFGTEQAKFIPEIKSAELLAKGCGKVLDARCLENMNGYKIRVQNCKSEIGKSGTIILHDGVLV
jgi:aspartokinase